MLVLGSWLLLLLLPPLSQPHIPSLAWQQAHHLSVTERFVFVTVW